MNQSIDVFTNSVSNIEIKSSSSSFDLADALLTSQLKDKKRLHQLDYLKVIIHPNARKALLNDLKKSLS